MRLTKTLKEQITKAALLDIFSAREESLAVKSTDLFRSIALHQALPDQEAAAKADAQLKALSDKFKKIYGSDVTRGGIQTDYRNHLYDGHDGEYIYHYQFMDGQLVRGTDGSPKTEAFKVYGDYGSSVPKDLPAHIQRDLEDYRLESSKFRADKSEMELTLEGCLGAATTVKRLVELYPDLEKYIPKGVGTAVALAVPPSELMGKMSKMREPNTGRKVGKLKAARMAKQKQ